MSRFVDAQIKVCMFELHFPIIVKIQTEHYNEIEETTDKIRQSSPSDWQRQAERETEKEIFHEKLYIV